MEPRSINTIDEEAMLQYPLWSYVPSRDGSLWLKPVKSLANLKNRMVTADITLANGQKMLGLIESLRLDSPNWSKHNRRAWIFMEKGKWFRLTEYFHYSENDNHGPEAFANILNKKMEEVFPIYFDAQRHLEKNSEILTGYFEVHPTWGVSLEEAVLMKG